MRYRYSIFTGVAALALTIGNVGCAKELRQRDFDIAAQELKYSLRDLARLAGMELIAPSDALEGRNAPALHGHYTAREALDVLLKGSHLSADIRDGAIIIEGRSGPPVAAAAPEGAGSDIVVTGSRIRGAPIASPTITVTQREMIALGKTRMVDVIRDIPQNFGGGVNPGVGVGVPEDKGTNLGGGASINLRGLGPDATLTLLNGHRLAYNVATQAIDISVIPVNAVDRLEIVADGSSALYGSDAVGGVANIILKTDYDGMMVSGRIAGSTDGGNFQQQYGAVGGHRWAGGGILVAYEFERDTAILGRQREYTKDRPALTLYPYSRHHNLLISGHQDLAETLILSVDALYNDRQTHRSYANTVDADYRIAGNKAAAQSTAYAVAPSLTWHPGPLEFSLVGMYGIDRSHYGSDNYRNARLTSQARGCYCNRAQSIELSGEAPLFALNGGNAKLAFGAGYRNNDFHAFRTMGAAQNIRASQDSYYGFAEASLPLIGPEAGLGFVHRLNLSAAVRYENYPGVDHVATPKFGVIYAPSEDLDIKGSWGRSFKAPTLYQRYNATGAEIYPAAELGAQGAAPNAAAILLSGGNRNLKPEHATSWTVTLAAHPRVTPGLTIEIGYFNVRYRDRIVEPITFLSQSLSNPIYADLVGANPSAAAQQAALAGGLVFDYTEVGYDPSNVIALIHDEYLNVARQSLHGLDGSVRYRAELGTAGALTITGSASYLDSKQRQSQLQPDVALAGSIFNPPNFRGKLGVTWESGPTTATVTANHIGSLKDVRSSPSVHIASQTLIDINTRYEWMTTGLLKGFSVGLSVQNLFNTKPDIIRTNRIAESPYDSTSFSAFGRVVGVSVAKAW